MTTAGSVVPYQGNGSRHDSNGSGFQSGYIVRHGLPGTQFVQVAWGAGNCLNLSYIPNSEASKGTGKIVQVTLGPSMSEAENGAESRRVSVGSLPFFVELQSRRRELNDYHQGMNSSNWWEVVLKYSRGISNLLGSEKSFSHQHHESTKAPKSSAVMWAVWDLFEIFYVDKNAESWFPERLVDWLAKHCSTLSKPEFSLSLKLAELMRRLSIRQFPEEDSEYWSCLASALAIGWFDFVITLLRMHGSYRHDQIDKRQTENGLVEAVAVLISQMPRLRSSLPTGTAGVAFTFKPEFAKEWERWRTQVAKLDRSAFWKECHNAKTHQGLNRLLAIVQGSTEVLVESTFNWVELLTAHYLHVRPFASGTEGLLSITNLCKEYKSDNSLEELEELILAIFGDNTEVVIAECVKLFEPWMLAHMVELLTAKNAYVENLLRKEREVQGGISLEELYRVAYAQSVASHPLTWQVAPVYLAASPGQGLGMLETMLLKLPIMEDTNLALKALDVCRMYDLHAVGSILCRRVGVHAWKHGRMGAGIVWLQRAQDRRILSSISDQLLAAASTDDWEHVQSFEQVQGLVDLLGTEIQATGGLSILHRYKNFKSAMQNIWDMRSKEVDKQQLNTAGRQATDCMMDLFKIGVTPKRFWMSVLEDSVELLEWPDQVLLTTEETNLLLNCLQEFKWVKLWDETDRTELTGPNVDRVRLALATNLARSFLHP